MKGPGRPRPVGLLPQLVARLAHKRLGRHKNGAVVLLDRVLVPGGSGCLLPDRVPVPSGQGCCFIPGRLGCLFGLLACCCRGRGPGPCTHSVMMCRRPAGIRCLVVVVHTPGWHTARLVFRCMEQHRTYLASERCMGKRCIVSYLSIPDTMFGSFWPAVGAQAQILTAEGKRARAGIQASNGAL